jgi:hypothetical protein
MLSEAQSPKVILLAAFPQQLIHPNQPTKEEPEFALATA